jgi:DNA-binding XRE family transcriptional regulator
LSDSREEFERLLSVTTNGPVNTEPLESFGYRFEPKKGAWQILAKFNKSLPKSIMRSSLAKEIGVPEQVIVDWEQAMLKIKITGNPTQLDAIELLRVGENGEINSDPLGKWAVRYYPQSKVWRRTRSHRNEVSRLEVAKKVGVAEEIIAAWEMAANAKWERDNVN